jgi:hypothetical protein
MANLSATERVLLGGSAGAISVMCKFLAQDYNLLKAAATLSPEQILNLQVGYAVLTPILMIMGGFIAWISQENNRMKLVALAISAPALFTTMAGGGDRIGGATSSKAAGVGLLEYLVPTAHAQVSAATTEPKARDAGRPAPQEVSSTASAPAKFDPSVGRVPPPKQPAIPASPEDITAAERVRRGVSAWFGHGIEPPRYRVIVGSYIGPLNAQRFAESINKTSPELTAAVFPPKGDSNYYTVVLGDYVTLARAKELKDVAFAKGYSDAWISPEKK